MKRVAMRSTPTSEADAWVALSPNYVMLSLSLTTERTPCCRSVATLNVCTVAFLGRNMRQAPTYRIVDSACSRVGRATQTANTFLAALCLFFGSALAAFVPASFEARIVYLFFVGLIPALGFYLTGHILRHMLGLSCKLCRIIAARCLRWLAPFAKDLVDWARTPVSDGLDRCSMTLARCRFETGQWMQRLSRLARKAYCSVDRRYRRVHWAIFEFSCLLIRNTARFIIRMQQSVD